MQGQLQSARDLEKLLEREDRIIALHTTDPDAAIVEFRLICRRTGRAMYHWSDVDGVVSMKAADIAVPGCQKLADALRYVVQSMHYGVYVFTQFERQLRPAAIARLKEILRMHDHRTVILVSAHLDLPPRLNEQICHVRFADASDEPPRPRLRDGRWVL